MSSRQRPQWRPVRLPEFSREGGNCVFHPSILSFVCERTCMGGIRVRTEGNGQGRKM